MGLGVYDESEHERREDMIQQTDEGDEDYNTERYQGEIEYEFNQDGEIREDEEVIDEMLQNLNS